MTDPRTILVLSPWPAVRSMEGGGGTPVLTDLLESLVAGGNDVHLVLPQGAADPGTLGDVVFHRIRPLPTARRWIGRPVVHAISTVRLTAAALRIGWSLRRVRAVYGLSAQTVPAAALAASILRRPSVGVLFGTYFYPALRSTRARLSRFEEWIAFRTPVTRLVVLNDGTQGDRVAERLNVPESRFRFWMHGLDFEACDAALEAPDARSELGIPADAPLVVSSSRLASWKRVDRVIEAFAQVRAEHPGALLAIAGSGPDRGRLDELVARSGLADSVRFVGPLPRELNLRLFVTADVVCCFYDFSNVGVSLLEALACGAPVVVGDTGATADFVDDGSSGLVVPEGDLAAAAAAIGDLLAAPERRRALGSEARRRARASFLSRAARRQLELDLLDEIS